ncbi:bifunctional 2-polyprenyl-6-hydroxyphenol methylase/3-demethylubiquinol 3-O-methyltransferase UbiG [Flavobacterium sp. ov086]|uniref:class I SAM-dependent methyltransferase n=1 Tax=Flavobacterium sp. ov086 TaxID=1761785 RepID=UPI000B751D78|nr:methyltransferase domain-containing protein [Flavobacterium sp. ov086]SNR95349.1 Methyltransferase domain-containing protein [Flavobacterium sp. ov086]
MNEKVKYIHEENFHNFGAANEIVPFIINLLEPKSVVDVGCGIGTWLKIFKDKGVIDILGIDGGYVDKRMLKINQKNFKEFDLEKFYRSKRKFDLAISLEVAEHLSPTSADDFVKTLIGLSNIIIFSAAIPYQGGQNHINENKPSYWIEKFEKSGFKLYDVLRPQFWNNENIDSWYKQNIFLFTNQINLDSKLNTLKSFYGSYLVHPEIFKYKVIEHRHYKFQYETIMDALPDENIID